MTTEPLDEMTPEIFLTMPHHQQAEWLFGGKLVRDNNRSAPDRQTPTMVSKLLHSTDTLHAAREYWNTPGLLVAPEIADYFFKLKQPQLQLAQVFACGQVVAITLSKHALKDYKLELHSGLRGRFIALKLWDPVPMLPLQPDIE